MTGAVRATLGAIVWPVYLGMSTGHPGVVEGAVPLHEPFDDIDYERGQITWVRQPDGEILGRARVCIPKGVWTHYVFCSGFQPAALLGARALEQPLVFDRAGFVDVDPIYNREVLPRNGAALL
jgi:hypothetical protein